MLADYFAMGGYGYYIWMSYGVTAFFMIAEVFLVIRNKRTILQRVTRMIRMNKMQQVKE
ncbi:MAG: heme exporter protein CcmD [Thiohalomonadales bacterium]